MWLTFNVFMQSCRQTFRGTREVVKVRTNVSGSLGYLRKKLYSWKLQPWITLILLVKIQDQQGQFTNEVRFPVCSNVSNETSLPIFLCLSSISYAICNQNNLKSIGIQNTLPENILTSECSAFSSLNLWPPL